ncbi:MAG: response regulator transcription factor [Mariprofundaceae bacterium]
MSATIRVQLVGDRELIRAGLRALIDADPGFILTEEAICSSNCKNNCVHHQPDVVVLSLALQGAINLACIRGILRLHPTTRVLVLTDYEDSLMASRALKAGASGYLSHTSPPEVFIHAVRDVALGNVFIERSVAHHMAVDKANNKQDAFYSLSERQFEIFLMLADGKSRADIANQLHLSPNTVSNHHSHIMRKLGIENQVALAKLAIRHGVITG